MGRTAFISKENISTGVIDITQKESDIEAKKKRLTELVNEYAELDSLIKEKTKIAKEQNAEIKELMKDLDITSFDGDDYTAIYSIRKKEYFDEEPMMEWMKRRRVAQWSIKTREYIDMKIFEDALYQGKISEMNLDYIKSNFKKCDETVALSMKKRKEKKDG